MALASYLGTSDVLERALASFAETYADQNERDYRQLIDAAQTGVITARSGI